MRVSNLSKATQVAFDEGAKQIFEAWDEGTQAQVHKHLQDTHMTSTFTSLEHLLSGLIVREVEKQQALLE